MKQIMFPLLALTAGALLIPATSDATPGGSFGSKLRSRLTISVDLVATAAGTVGSTGTVEIKVKQKDAVQEARLELTVNALPVGAYSLDATLDDSSAVHLGDFAVPVAPAPESDDSDLTMTLPAGLDARTLATITVSDAAAVVVLEGDATAWIDRESYFANVAVTGEEGRVHGHALLISKSEAGVETGRHVLFIGFGAAGDATLTINVDGVAAGTVVSTKQGHVKFMELDEAITLSAIHLITLTDETNTVIMQAQF